MTYSMPSADDLEIKGYIENESSYRLKETKRFSKIQNILELETKYYISDEIEFYSKDRFIYDAVYDLVIDYKGEPYRSYRLNWNFKEIFPEFYLEYTYGDMIITGGVQHVVWGEAVGLKITDIVNPTDFREFILDDFLDSRIGLWMLKFNYSYGDSIIEWIVIPDFEPNKPASQGSEWQMNSSDTGTAFIPILHRTDMPADSLENSDLGIRFNTIIESWDISLYYLYSWDDNPTFHTFINGNTKDIFPEHHRLHTYGGTFNYAIGKTVFTGEMAVYSNKYFQTSDMSDTGYTAKRDYLNYMIGSEYILNNFTNLSAQLIQKVILGDTEKLLKEKINSIITLFIQMDFLNETLNPSLLLLYGMNKGDTLFRPKVEYKLNDSVKLAIGFDLFDGSKESLLGQFLENNRFSLEVRRSF